jgi:hypothetical protein
MMKVQWFDIGLRAEARVAAGQALPSAPGIFMLFAQAQADAWVPLLVGMSTSAAGVCGWVAGGANGHYAYTGGATPSLIAKRPDHAAFLGAVEAHYGHRTGWLVASFSGATRSSADVYATALRQALKAALAPLWDTTDRRSVDLAADLPAHVEQASHRGADLRGAAVALLNRWAEVQNVRVRHSLWAAPPAAPPAAGPAAAAAVAASPRAAAALRMATHHAEVDPAVVAVYSCDPPDAAPSAPLQLVEVNTDTPERGVVPVALRPIDRQLPSAVIVELTPAEWAAVTKGELRLPEGWAAPRALYRRGA